ncbi:MAG: ABC transporter permease [Flavobacteriia bacterium]|nr:ABC transporter permease [Flavobacteriia bacterium]
MEYEIKTKNKFSFGFRELNEYRELFYFFTWRDVKVKYKQTVLGFLWAILQPLFLTFIFTFAFKKSLSTKTEIEYVLFLLSGMLIWNLFSSGLNNSSNSMINNSNIIKKIYFPRLILPISSIFVSVIDYLITLGVFFIVVLFYDESISLWAIILIPLSLLSTIITTTGIGLFMAALNVKYRDVRYVLPFFIQSLMFLSPIIFPLKISDNILFEFILKYNPLSGSLELMRGSFEKYILNWDIVIGSSAVSILFFIFGFFYFRKTENYFADIV